jgi:tetratricopeptide (TPR) repeat protein
MSDPLPTLEDAEEAFASGLLDDALAICEVLVEQDPGDVAALYLMAEAMLDLDEFEGAEEVFRDVLRFEPDSAGCYTGLGVALFEQCRFDEARRALETANDLDPRIGESRMYLGYFHERRGEFDKALECYESAVELAPDRFVIPQTLTDEQLQATAREVVTKLPTPLQDYLSATSWTVDFLPPTSLLTRNRPPLSPLTLCLFLGPVRDPLRVEQPLSHAPIGVALFRANFEKSLHEGVVLADVVRNALLAEVELFLNLSREEVADLGLESLYRGPHWATGEPAIDPAFDAFAEEPIPPDRTLH